MMSMLVIVSLLMIASKLLLPYQKEEGGARPKRVEVLT